jgi:hypothetical protein
LGSQFYSGWWQFGVGEGIPTLDPDLGKELSTRQSQRIETNDNHAIAVTPDVTLSLSTDHGKVG